MVVVDEPTLYAESLRTALTFAGYDVLWLSAAQASSGGMEPFTGAVPHAAVLDLDLADGRSATPLLEQLVARGIRVAVVTASDDHAEWARCLELGASGVVPKTLPLADVVATVGRLAAGESLMTPWELQQLQRETEEVARREQEMRLRFERLTSDESWLLGQLMEGRVAHDIARVSHRPPAAVHAMVTSVLLKLQVPTWLGAVGLANDYGWRPPENAEGS